MFNDYGKKKKIKGKKEGGKNSQPLEGKAGLWGSLL
jgi:hypothetical protein